MSSATPGREPSGQETLKATDSQARQGLAASASMFNTVLAASKYFATFEDTRDINALKEAMHMIHSLERPVEPEHAFVWLLSARDPDRVIPDDEISSSWAKYLEKHEHTFPVLNDLRISDVVRLVTHLRKFKLYIPTHLISGLLIDFAYSLEKCGHDTEKGPDTAVHETIAWFQRKFPQGTSETAHRLTVETSLPNHDFTATADIFDRCAQLLDSHVSRAKDAIIAETTGSLAAFGDLRHNDEAALFSSLAKFVDDRRFRQCGEVFRHWDRVDRSGLHISNLTPFSDMANDFRAKAAIYRRADAISENGGEGEDGQTEDAEISDA